MTVAGDDRFRSLREAFVIGGTSIGEKQEQIKNEIGVTSKIPVAVGGRGPPWIIAPGPAAPEP